MKSKVNLKQNKQKTYKKYSRFHTKAMQQIL